MALSEKGVVCDVRNRKPVRLWRIAGRSIWFGQKYRGWGFMEGCWSCLKKRKPKVAEKVGEIMKRPNYPAKGE